MTIRRLAKNIGGSFDLFKFYDYNQEINFFSRLFINKSKVGVKYVKIFQKPIKIFLCIGPNVLISILLTCLKYEIEFGFQVSNLKESMLPTDVFKLWLPFCKNKSRRTNKAFSN